MIEFGPASYSDIQFIVQNLRQSDKQEIYCQLEDEAELLEAAQMLESTACFYKSEPVALVSLTPINLATAAINVFGTDKTRRVIPEITRFIFTELIPDALSVGVRRFEARSISTHSVAHQWMEAAGFVREGVLNEMGINGEQFYLYAITKPMIENLELKRWQR